jgi:hypothetical protein
MLYAIQSIHQFGSFNIGQYSQVSSHHSVCVKLANNELARYGSKVKFEVCEHKPPKISRFCPDAAGMFPYQLQGVT